MFDSSFLMSVSEHPTQWLQDMDCALGKVEPVLLDCVEEELSRMVSRGGKKGKLAAVAIEASSGFERRPCGGADVDDEVVSAALELRGAVATSDGDMARVLRALNVRVASLRGGRVYVG